MAYKKGLQKLGTDRPIRRQGRAFEHYFGPRGGNLNNPIFKSSNVRGLPPPEEGGGGGGMLKFRVDTLNNKSASTRCYG